MIRREYRIEARYGYYAVDEYLNGKCTRTIQTNMKKKDAIALADALSNAIHTFICDNGLDP